MRTTVDLTPEALYLAKSIARDTRQSLGKTISELILREFSPAAGSGGWDRQANGLPLFRSGRRLSSDDVNRLKDEEWLYGNDLPS